MLYEVGDIFQVKPSSENERFRGCLIVADEIKDFGVVGYVQVPGEGVIPVRCKYEDLVFVGKVCYMQGLITEELQGWVRTSHEINA